jgi:hypothetical protein
VRPLGFGFLELSGCITKAYATTCREIEMNENLTHYTNLNALLVLPVSSRPRKNNALAFEIRV